MNLLDELKGKSILHGARGKTPIDTEAIVDVLLKVSALMIDHGEQIQELDINPLVVYEKGIRAADAMLVVKEQQVIRQAMEG